MDMIEKIVIAVIIFSITSILAYLFKLRQLYVIVPKLYKHAPITNKGALCEIIIINRGTQVEEDISVDLVPDLSYTLIAGSSSELELNGTSIKIRRIHKKSEESAILLVENGNFDVSKIISASSKATKGKIHKRVADVPPNAASIFLFLVCVIGFFPGLIYGHKLFTYTNNYWTQYKYSQQSELGWNGLENYSSSNTSESYSKSEFPVRLIKKEKINDKWNFTYEAYNKTALPLIIYTDQEKIGTHRAGESRPYFSSLELPPMSKDQFTAMAPASAEVGGYVSVDFSFKNGEEFFNHIFQKIPVSN